MWKQRPREGRELPQIAQRWLWPTLFQFSLRIAAWVWKERRGLASENLPVPLLGPVSGKMASPTGKLLYQLEWFHVAAAPSLPPYLLLCKLRNNPMTCEQPYFPLSGWRHGEQTGAMGHSWEVLWLHQAFPLLTGGCGGLDPGSSSTGWAAQGQWIPVFTYPLTFSSAATPLPCWVSGFLSVEWEEPFFLPPPQA